MSISAEAFNRDVMNSTFSLRDFWQKAFCASIISGSKYPIHPSFAANVADKAVEELVKRVDRGIQ